MITADELLESTNDTVNVENTKQWLYQYITSILEIPESEINATVPLYEYGLDSSAVVGLVADLSEWSAQPLAAKIIKKHNTIDALAKFVGNLNK